MSEQRLLSLAPPPSTLPPVGRGQRYVLVVYDVSCDARRTRMGEACLNHGLLRVQQSVYCGPIRASRLPSLRAALARLAYGVEERVGAESLSAEQMCESWSAVSPQARVLMLFLDAGTAWWGVHVPSPRVRLSAPSFALRPRVAADFIFIDDDLPF